MALAATGMAGMAHTPPAFVSVHLDCTIDPATRRLGVEVTGERGALLDLFFPGQNLSVWLVEDGVETKDKQKGIDDESSKQMN